jgi:arylsulfatase A-like enzyme
LSDHGISIGEKFGERAYGAFCYDYTIRTFAYMISNDLPKIEIGQQVRHVDFLPTILDYLEIPLDDSYKKIDGQSLRPLIEGKTLEERIAYTETGNPLNQNEPPKEPNTKSVRTSKWKLIINEYNNSKELYNLVDDPDEENNLVDQNLSIEKELWNEFVKLQNTD